MSDTMPWIVEVLANECQRTPATQLAMFTAKANDLLERLGHDWRLTATGAARHITRTVSA